MRKRCQGPLKKEREERRGVRGGEGDGEVEGGCNTFDGDNMYMNDNNQEFRSPNQTYNDPEPKSAQQTSQPSHLLPPKQPLYSVPPQPSSPYLGPPGSFPLSDLQSYAGPPRHTLAPTLSQSQMLPPSMSASPPALLPDQPTSAPPRPALPAQHQSSLLNQPIRMQQSQPIISHQMGLQAPLHSPPLSQQGFSHIQADYQNSVGGSQSPGAPNPVHGQNPDWDSEYCNRDCGPNHCG
ncbi:hypothetical protein D9C73_011527 [Collichthys lucidus]|uniref:TOX high mobility group box family member 2 n=1 Tax=Collichthys lucidus TaxID=240159 RepID=A0A4U5UQU1_COLLU|nr:hypothetical protein D9C73_011527 [Collichthys lucidus]